VGGYAGLAVILALGLAACHPSAQRVDFGARSPSPSVSASPVLAQATRSAVTPSSGSAPPQTADLLALHAFEDGNRAEADFSRPKTSDIAFGADPYVIRSLVAKAREPLSEARFVGILRGQSAIVELDGALNEVARLAAPESTTGLAVASTGEVFAVGELSNRVARYRADGGALRATGAIELSDVRAMRDVATGPEGVVYVTEEHDGRLLTLKPQAEAGVALPAARLDTALCHGPLHVLRVANFVLVDCLLDHAVVIRPVDSHGFPEAGPETRIVHDGPMWGLDALSDGGALLIAAGGVEDHPLDRTEGSFGFVDSFVTLYRVAGGKVERLSEVNTSALGVITPKALNLARGAAGDIQLAIAGYGSDRFARIDWKDDAGPPGGRHEAGPLDEPEVVTSAVAPGTAMMQRLADGSFVLANPLIDAWVHVTAEGSAVAHVADSTSTRRSSDLRLGEALFFTTLIAPWDKTEGRLSRFTCETCHFEGYADGRTHRTGRGDILATTKPLLGLFNNKPYFSRALDPDLTTMVNNEFRVAGAKSDHDPWFSLATRDFPWTAELGVPDETLSPEALRRALMTFFMGFAHRPNPSVVGRSQFTDLETQGAVVFRDKCESCHEARLLTDDPSTRQPFETWQSRVMAPEGALVWAHAEYEKTGVEPYVNEKGARVVSLRRLYKKYPYFTNGSAKSIANVLDRARFADGHFFHEGAPERATALRADEKAGLAAFLDLL
jgi:hypothetical protein